MIKNIAPNQPVPVEPQASAAPRPPARSHFGARAFTFASISALFWTGSWAAGLWGFLGVSGLAALDLAQIAMLTAAIFLPPLLFYAVATALVRSAAMTPHRRSDAGCH